MRSRGVGIDTATFHYTLVHQFPDLRLATHLRGSRSEKPLQPLHFVALALKSSGVTGSKSRGLSRIGRVAAVVDDRVAQHSGGLKLNGVGVNDTKVGVTDDRAPTPQPAPVFPAKFEPVKIEPPSFSLHGYPDVVATCLLPKTREWECRVSLQSCGCIRTCSMQIMSILTINEYEPT